MIQFSIYINGFDYVVREIVGFTYFNVTFIIEAATAVIDEKLRTNSLISDMQLNSFSLTNGANLLSQGMVSLSHKHKLMNGVVNQSWQTTFRATTFDHYGTMVANSDRSKVIGASGPPFVCQRHKLRLRCLGVVTYKFQSLENDQQLKVLNNANYKPLVNSNLITILWKALDSDDSLDAHAFVIMLINCKVVVFIHCKGEFNIASLKEVVARNCWLKDLEIIDAAELFGLFRKELMGAKSLVSVDWEQLVVEILDKFVTNLILFNDTKVENKLQSRVFSCISKLAHRGIQSWVLTGYTMEIILTIGFACSLLTQGMLWSIKSTNNVRILIDWFDSFKGSYLVGFPGFDRILLLRQQARHATCVLATKLGLIDHLKIFVAEPIVREIVGNINGISSYLFGYYAESSCVISIVASITSIETTSDYAARTYSLIICLLGLVVSNILYQDQLEVVLSAMGTTIGEFPLMKNVGPYESPFIFTLSLCDNGIPGSSFSHKEGPIHLRQLKIFLLSINIIILTSTLRTRLLFKGDGIVMNNASGQSSADMASGSGGNYPHHSHREGQVVRKSVRSRKENVRLRGYPIK